MITKVETTISKDVDDIFALLMEIIRLRKAGKGPMEIASGALDELMEAIDGIGNIDDDWKEDMAAVMRTGAIRAADIAALLMEKPAEPESTEG